MKNRKYGGIKNGKNELAVIDNFELSTNQTLWRH